MLLLAVVVWCGFIPAQRLLAEGGAAHTKIRANDVMQDPVSRNFKVKDGLISNEAHHVLSDSKGFIWIATDGGICRYDGTKFTKFSLAEGLPERMVTKLYEDKKGRIWFITISSHIGYILNDKISVIRHRFKEGPVNSVVDDFAYSIYVDEHDTLWVGTIFSGIVYKSAYPYKARPVMKKMRANFVLEFNKKGEYIFGTYQLIAPKNNFSYTLKLVYDQQWKHKEHIYQFKAQFQGYQWNRIVKAGPGEFYLSNKNSLFSIRNGKYTEETDQGIASFEIDRRGRLWVCTIGKGIYLYPDRKNRKNYKRYYLNEYVTDLATDKQGGTWISTLYSGVKYVPNFNFISLLQEEKELDCIVKHKNLVVVNQKLGDLIAVENDKELARYKGTVFYFTPHPFSGHMFCYTLDSRGYYGEIEIPAMKPVKKSSYGKSIAYIKSMREYKSTYYILADNRIYTYDFKNFKTRLVLVSNSRVNDLVILNDTAWIATNNGLFNFDIKSGKWIKNEFASGKLNFRIDNIVSAHKGLWLNTFGKGLCFYNKKNKLKTYDRKNGLLSNYIRYIYLDDLDNLWVASNEGLSRIELRNKNRIINYAYLGSYDMGQINKILRLDTDLYLTTTNGLYKLPIEELDIQNKVLPLYITSVSSSYVKKIRDNDMLEYGDSHLKIEFLSTNYASSQNREYYYFIRGLDNTWHKTTNTSLTINKLPPGEYSFIVKTASNSHAKLHFSIKYPLWQKWWFICLVLFLLAFVAYQALSYRTRKIKEEEQEKNNIQVQIAGLQANVIRAQMNPHFMFNALNSIQGFILANENKQANFYLGKFSSLMRKIIQLSKHDFVTIKEELRLLQDYIEIEQMRCGYSFDSEINMDQKEILGTRIPAMIIQPFIENAINHGLSPLVDRKGKLTITFSNIGKNIICTITDNGIGRTKAMEIKQKKIRYHQSASIKLTENRIQLYNKLYKSESRISIIDLYDDQGNAEGTRVEIIIPAK
ncbi:MAG: histidine kinase [Bacteroidota bacterium]